MSLGWLLVAVFLNCVSRCKWGACPQTCPLPAHLSWSTTLLGMPSPVQLKAIFPSASSVPGVLGVPLIYFPLINEWWYRIRGRIKSSVLGQCCALSSSPLITKRYAGFKASSLSVNYVNLDRFVELSASVYSSVRSCFVLALFPDCCEVGMNKSHENA